MQERGSVLLPSPPDPPLPVRLRSDPESNDSGPPQARRGPSAREVTKRYLIVFVFVFSGNFRACWVRLGVKGCALRFQDLARLGFRLLDRSVFRTWSKGNSALGAVEIKFSKETDFEFCFKIAPGPQLCLLARSYSKPLGRCLTGVPG